MVVGSVLNTGLTGLQRSSREMQKSAQEIAEIGTVQRNPEPNGQVAGFNPGDLAAPIVNMKVEQLIFEASAKVVDVGSETLGTLIDIKS